jgi:hypothetical protein
MAPASISIKFRLQKSKRRRFTRGHHSSSIPRFGFCGSEFFGLLVTLTGRISLDL